MADLFMSALKKKFLDYCHSWLKPTIYVRYADDTFCLFNSEECVTLFFDHINNCNNSIKFLVQKKYNNWLPFLDILIHIAASNFSTTRYRKPTFTGLYISFSTLSPNKYKVNLISILVSRAFNISSSYITFHSKLVTIKHILIRNCYPSTAINNVKRKLLNERFSSPNKPHSPDQNKLRIAFFPFLVSVILVLKYITTSLNSLNLTTLVSCYNLYIKLPNDYPLYLSIRISSRP